MNVILSMKSVLIFSVIALVVATSCKSKSSKQKDEQMETSEAVTFPTPVITEEITGYFVKNASRQKEDLKLLVIKDQASFNELFGTAKTIDNEVIVPDFNTSVIVALVSKAIKFETTIRLNKTELDKGILNIYFSTETGTPKSYTFAPAYLFAVEKDIPAKQLRLFVNGMKKGVISFL